VPKVSKTAQIIVFATVVLALAAVGCGGGNSGSAGSAAEGSSAASTQEFIKQADAICSKGEKQTEAEFAAFLKKNNIKGEGQGQSRSEASAHELEVVEEIAIPALHRQLDELRALEVPSADHSKVEAYFDATDEEIKKSEGNPRSLLGLAATVFAKSDKAAKEIGFKVCGNH
jgi:hypothetical protein